MTVSRLEINIKRLLKNTEALSRNDSSSSNWKLERYVNALNDMLQELQRSIEKPDPDKLKEYIRRIEFLKKLVYTEKINNPVQKVVALQMMSHGVSTPDGNISREIQQKTASKCILNIRNELFGMNQEGTNDELRYRKQEKSMGEDLDSVIKYNKMAQDRILDDMLGLTRELKEQTVLANNIIKKDIKTLHKSSGLADQNLGRLKIESKRLDDHNKRAWKCWMWLLMLVVLIIFLFMVFFMKITKKRTS